MFQIGDIQVNLSMREVRVDGHPIPLGSRAFDILELLICAEGQLVSKDAIIRHVWPETIVEENNLQVHISALRKMLGAYRDLIKTVPGRGYRMVRANDGVADADPAVAVTKPVLVASQSVDDLDALQAKRVAPPVRETLPARVSTLIGREDATRELTMLLNAGRHVTVVGAGGMGKTSLAIEVARRVASDYPDGVFLLSLAPVADEAGVVDELVKATGVVRYCATTAVASTLSALSQRKILFVIDNCEHVLDAAAELTEAILQTNPVARVLATSRESLHTAGEILYALPPLATPGTGAPEHEVRDSSAVALFLQRAKSVDPSFAPDERGIRLIGTICRRLDGMPLAIELAAARAVMLGIREVLCNLDDRFRTLTGGRRTALPRHQTLKATLDWSHELLSDTERVVLRRLGIFVDGFTLNAAKSVVCNGEFAEEAMVGALSGLVAKSLVVATRTGVANRYRLLETTRAYALQKLDDYGEYRRTAACHALYIRDCAAMYGRRGGTTPDGDAFSEQLAREVGNMRAALSWAFSGRGDETIAVPLAAACAFFFFDGSRMAECCEWALKALDIIEHGKGAAGRHYQQKDVHLRLLAALAAGLVYAEGPTKRTRALWHQTLTLAMKLGCRDFEARAIWGLWNAAQYAGESRDAIDFAHRFRALAVQTGNSANEVLGQRLLGISLHFSGQQTDAYRELAQMLLRYDNSRHQLDLLGFTIDHRVVGQATLSRVLWLRGQREQGLRMAEESMANGRAQEHDLCVAYALVEALIPLTMLSGQWAQARAYNTALKDLAVRSGFRIWEHASACFDAVLHSIDDAGGLLGLAAFAPALAAIEAAGFLAHRPFLLGYYGQGLARAGSVEQGIAQIELALAICCENGDHWYSSELWRIRGEMLLAAGGEGGRAETPTLACEEKRDGRDGVGADTDRGPRNDKGNGKRNDKRGSNDKRRSDVATLTTPRACFERAIEIAASQGAEVFRLRALASLAMLPHLLPNALSSELSSGLSSDRSSALHCATSPNEPIRGLLSARA